MEVVEIQSEDTQPLRYKVLWQHKAGVDECVIDIDKRADAIHLGAVLDGQVIGIASLFELYNEKVVGEKQYRLRAMATDPDVRGSGAGRAVVEKAIEILKAKGYDTLWCDAREVALGFYEKLGFKCTSDWYHVPQIGPHKRMEYYL